VADLVASLIYYFIKLVPKAGRTQLVKFLYLTDLEARRHLGRPLTALQYYWHDHGPFDRHILARLDHLEREGFVKGTWIDFPGGKRGCQYTAERDFPAAPLGVDERAIVDFVAQAYGAEALCNLLEEVVYQTLPMKDAKKRGAREELLRMELVDNDAIKRGEGIERIRRAVDELERGGGRLLDDVATELGI
jgi:hypothetical protein